MLTSKEIKMTFIEAFFLVLIIYILSIFLNGFLDDLRSKQIENTIIEIEIENQLFLANRIFYDTFSNYDCNFKKQDIINQINKTRIANQEFYKYESLILNFNKINIEDSKTKLYLEQISLLDKINQYEIMCEKDIFMPIIYFFDGSEESNFMKQLVIFKSIEDKNQNDTIVFYFDVKFTLQTKLIIQKLQKQYNLSYYPSYVVGETLLNKNINYDNFLDEKQVFELINGETN